MRLNFGEPQPGLDYRDRPSAFGLAQRQGQLAVVRVARGDDPPYLDLPGGALDAGEDEQGALVREFLEETGLDVTPVERLGEASQVFRKTDGEPVRNLAGFWTVQVMGETPDAKVEDDHSLLWIEPAEAVVSLRHEAHAWAVVLWLRRNGQGR